MPPKWTAADWASAGQIIASVAFSVGELWLLDILLQPALPLVGSGVTWAFAHWFFVGPVIWFVGWLLTR